MLMVNEKVKKIYPSRGGLNMGPPNKLCLLYKANWLMDVYGILITEGYKLENKW